jgi:hypothetical protein
MYDTVRIIEVDGRIYVRDLAFSQLSQYLKQMDNTARDEFYKGNSVILLGGVNIKLVDMDNILTTKGKHHANS